MHTGIAVWHMVRMNTRGGSTGGGPGTTRDIHGRVHVKGTAKQGGKPALSVVPPTSLVEQAQNQPVPDRLPAGADLARGVLRVPSASHPGTHHDVRAGVVAGLVQLSCDCPAGRYNRTRCRHAQLALDLLLQHRLVRPSAAGFVVTERGRQLGGVAASDKIG